MADEQGEAAAAAAPLDTPTANVSESGELEKHTVAIGSSFPELWEISSPDTDNDGGDDCDEDNEDIMQPETSKTEPEEAPIAKAEQANSAGAAGSAGESNDDEGTFKVSNLRATWKQKADETPKRSQLLNMNDFHMQQRQHRVGDKLKKGEAAEHLHNFRNHDAPTKPKDSAPTKKIPEPEQTKAADRAAMAQYMFLRQSKEKEVKPAAGGIVPHRTPALKAPTPDLLPNKSQDESVASSASSKSAKWVKSPTTGKNVIVTDVDEFYAQQHAIHIENERKKRQILHISDNKEVSPDKTSTAPSPNYKTSLIPALADSVSEDDSLAIASSSLSMGNADTELASAKDETTSRNLVEEYDGIQPEDGIGAKGEEEANEESVPSEKATEGEMTASQDEQDRIKEGSTSAREDNDNDGGQTVSALTPDNIDEPVGSNEISNVGKKEAASEPEESAKESLIEVQNEQSGETESSQKKTKDVLGSGEVDDPAHACDNSSCEEVTDKVAADGAETGTVRDAPIDESPAGEKEKTIDDPPSKAHTEEKGASSPDEIVTTADEGGLDTAIEEDDKVESKTLDETSEGVASKDEAIAMADESGLEDENESRSGAQQRQQDAVEQNIMDVTGAAIAQVAAEAERNDVEELPGVASSPKEVIDSTGKFSADDSADDSVVIADSQNVDDMTASEKEEVGGQPKEEHDVAMSEYSGNGGKGNLVCKASSDDVENCLEVVSQSGLDIEDNETISAEVENVETTSKSEEYLGLVSGFEGQSEGTPDNEEAGIHSEEIIDRSIDDDVAPSKGEVARAVEHGEMREKGDLPSEESSPSQISSDSIEVELRAPIFTPDEEIGEGDGDDSPLTDHDKVISPESAESRAFDVLAPKQTIVDAALLEKNKANFEKSVDTQDLDAAVLAETEQPVAEPIDHEQNKVSNVSAVHKGLTASVDCDDPSDNSNEEIDLGVAVSDALNTEVIDHVPDDVSNFSAGKDSTASVDGDELSDVIAEDIDLEVAVLEQPTTEVIDHVPDDVSNVSAGKDSTASVDGDDPSDKRDEEMDRGVEILDKLTMELIGHVPGDVPPGNKDSMVSVDGDDPLDNRDEDIDQGVAVLDELTTEVIDHVSYDVSNVSAGNKDSTASVHGEELSDVLSEDIDLEVAVLEQPSTEVIDHVPDDVSIVSEGDDDSIASVDGDDPSDNRDEEIDLEVAVLEQLTTEVIDHVPDDVSIVSEGDGDSTASVDGDELSDVIAEDIDLEVAAMDQPTEVIDHVPDDVSNVPAENDDSTASVDGDVTDSVVANFSDHVREESSAIPWDEGDELVLAELSHDDPDGFEAIPSNDDAEGDDAKAELGINVDREAPANDDAVIGQLESAVTAAAALAAIAEPKMNELAVKGQAEGNDAKSPLFDEVVSDELLASRDETSSELSAGEDQDVVERASADRQIHVESTLIDEAEEVGPHDESVLDELLASRNETIRKSSREAGDDEDLAKVTSAECDVEAALDDINTNAVVEELLGRNDDDSNPQPSDEDDESGNAVHVIENLLVDESALDVFEETEGDTSGIYSIPQDEEPLLHVDDRSELHEELAIGYAPSKDNDDMSPSEVIADFIRSGSRDESIEVLPKKSEISSAGSSATCSDSSEEHKPDRLSCAPSAGSTEMPAAANPGAKVEVDYKNVDYRGFVFVVHKSYGLMLLYCTRKKKKGPHYQLPGGHVDEPEFFAAAEQSRDGQTQLLLAARAGAARELYEETGMDVRYQLDRMEPAALRTSVEVDKNGKPILTNELKHRLYFFLPVTDDDFWSSDRGDSDTGKMHPLGAAAGCDGSQLMLKLSVEHQGWTFEKDPNKSAEKLAVHSGGQGAIALRMSMARGASSATSDLKDSKQPFNEGKAVEQQTNKELQSETWETEPLVRDEASGTDCPAATRSAPDLLPPPEASGIMKLFSCCLWFQSNDDGEPSQTQTKQN